uniref:Uncharacterized protein n=1 Tax=Castor canadensis TaxID=51338 RepID=A0A8C0WKH3_CASCN
MALLTAITQLLGSKNVSCLVLAARPTSASINLKDVLANLIPKEQARIKSFKQQHDKTGVVLDPEKSICFLGHNIPECQKLLPMAKGGKESCLRAYFGCLVTGQIPTEQQVSWLLQEWAKRAQVGFNFLPIQFLKII